jgi:hypothetical protein
VSDSAGSSHDSLRETADRDHERAAARSAGSEVAGEQRAEPMSREEYAVHMRQESGDGSGDGSGGSDDASHSGGPGDGDDSRGTDPAGQVQGMTRDEYAGFVRHEPAGADAHGADGDQGTGGPDRPGDTGGEPHREDPAERAQGMTRGEYADYIRQEPASEEEWPSPGEQARLHETYLDWREEIAAGRERGANVVGDKPDRSPGDTSDLPPTGEELLEGETGKHSRLDGLRREWEKEDVLDGLHSETEQDFNTIQSVLEAHPPEGHPVQGMPDYPNVAPVVPAGIDAGSVAAAGLMAGVVLVEAGRRFHDMLRQRRETDHAR